MNVITANVGPKYAGYTEKLYRALRRNTERDFNFSCATESKFPGWWSKFTHFPIEEQTLWIDMDMVIARNIDFALDYSGPFCIRRNPWQWNGTGWCDACLMSLSPAIGNRIATEFLENPEAIMRSYRSDQEFIADLIPDADTWQDLYPGKTASYKADNLENGPRDAAIISFHGDPKPAALLHIDWIREHWR